MTEQSEKIKLSSDIIRSRFPKRFKPELCIISGNISETAKEFKQLGELNYSDIPGFTGTENTKSAGKIIFAKTKKRDVLILMGRPQYFDGTDMRSIGHRIYVLKFLGIKKILSIDETAHLNPRFSCGEIALIYDHINLMGDNPLIGKNDETLGIRFPDMSNAYEKGMYKNIYKVFQENKIRINESVYLGITGPESETEAEARFYREIGTDVLGYSIVPENITAVHCGIEFGAIGLISRELIADKMPEDNRTQKQREKDQSQNYISSVKILKGIITELADKI
ncbi:MAG: purine-nucleoside phosphorylase [Ignavibacteria bacterium]|nr:purine-nucleoside phosphorylase [Ignavibacteria bacterium]